MRSFKEIYREDLKGNLFGFYIIASSSIAILFIEMEIKMMFIFSLMAITGMMYLIPDCDCNSKIKKKEKK